ncbi:hypothetical protein K470DRAFT_267003 [Piedraia hortae CBS 480.64]|uniref:Uncharacterized protein n=1 Tax=Piedraia hortae CBS 480.64 TaxID=1314780 RepID=A0A6A7BRA2_9PEZI|nr:hypothetical protein K470DRAFT_267003 [Piedraia hortae CBS 480.64]
MHLSPDPKTAFRVNLSPEALGKLDLKVGQLCNITTDTDGVSGYGIAWRANDRKNTPKTTPVKTTDIMRNAFVFKDNQQVIKSKAEGAISEASKVILQDIAPPTSENVPMILEEWRHFFVTLCEFYCTASRPLSLAEF